MNPSPPTLMTTLRSLPGSVWVLFAGTFLNRFGTFVVPFLALYLTQRGFTAAQSGFALGAYGSGHLCASLLGGQLADTFGRRKTILLSMFASAVTMLLFSQANSYWAILSLAFLAGLATETYRPAASALLTDIVPEEHRITAFAGYRIAINAGWAIGPAVGGFLAKHSYFWLFVGDAITSLLFGILGGFILCSIVVPYLQNAAMLMAAVSMLGFALLTWSVGGYNAELTTVLRIDLLGLLFLCAAAVIKFGFMESQ